jgi:hypothetical protein
MIRLAWVGAALCALLFGGPAGGRAASAARGPGGLAARQGAGGRDVGGGARRQHRPAGAAVAGDAAREPRFGDQAADHDGGAGTAGPGLAWQTPVWMRGPLSDGVLEGSSSSRAAATPSWCWNACGCCCAACSSWACATSAATSCWTTAPGPCPRCRSPADFDGEPLRPYNVRPAALLFNFRSVILQLRARPGRRRGQGAVEPPLAAARSWTWRAAGRRPLQRLARRAEGQLRTRRAPALPASYAASLRRMAWPVADPLPATYEARLLEALWREMGGVLYGSVREARRPRTRSRASRCLRRRCPKWCATSTSSATT